MKRDNHVLVNPGSREILRSWSVFRIESHFARNNSWLFCSSRPRFIIEILSVLLDAANGEKECGENETIEVRRTATINHFDVKLTVPLEKMTRIKRFGFTWNFCTLDIRQINKHARPEMNLKQVTFLSPRTVLLTQAGNIPRGISNVT